MSYMINDIDALQAVTDRKEKEILVFATSIRSHRELKQIQTILGDIPGIINWNVDLEDWEKVLRIEGVGVSSSLVMRQISSNGFFIKELE